MLRLKLMMVIGGLFLVWMGGRNIYEAAASGGQKTMPYTQFVQKHPGMGWYKVTNAGWDLEDAMYAYSEKEGSSTKTISTVFLPVHVAGAPAGTKQIDVVLETDRADLKNIFEQVENGGKPTPPDSLLHYAGNIEGTVAFGGAMDDKDRNMMKDKLGSALSPNYVVIRDGAKPNGGTGFLMLIGGIVLTGFGGVLLLGRR